MNNLYKKYKEEIVPALKEGLKLKNVMQVPKIEKVVINVGVGKHTKEKDYIENVEKTLTKVTGQKPVQTKAKKAISNFKIREGNIVGLMVTLRGKRMYDFLEKLLSVTFPRVRDFRGISSKSFDKQGNYSLGFKENIAFPEITIEDSTKIHGLEITVKIKNANSKEESLALLDKLGFPFAKK